MLPLGWKLLISCHRSTLYVGEACSLSATDCLLRTKVSCKPTMLLQIFINLLLSSKQLYKIPVHIMFENRVLRRIFRTRRDEVTGEWRRLHNEELNDLYSSPNIVRVIKSRRMRWAGHVARMGEVREVYRVLVGKPEGRRPLGRPRRRWVDNIRMDLQEVGCLYMDWIGLAQDRDRWRTLVSTVMNLRVPWNAGNFLTSCKPVSFSRTLHHGVSMY